MASPNPATTAATESAYRDGSYHRQVFDTDPTVETVLSRVRAEKIQPWVHARDAVFEFGVGTGLNLRDIDCRSKTGYDIFPSLADACEQSGIDFVSETAVLNEQFDVAICHHVLEHVADPTATLNLLADVLVPGGRLFLVVPYEFNRRYRHWRPAEPNQHLFAWNPMSLGNLVSSVGLRVEQVEIRPYGYQQRLARLARLGMPVYRTAVAIANALRPCLEIQLVARRSA